MAATRWGDAPKSHILLPDDISDKPFSRNIKIDGKSKMIYAYSIKELDEIESRSYTKFNGYSGYTGNRGYTGYSGYNGQIGRENIDTFDPSLPYLIKPSLVPDKLDTVDPEDIVEPNIIESHTVFERIWLWLNRRNDPNYEMNFFEKLITFEFLSGNSCDFGPR